MRRPGALPALHRCLSQSGARQSGATLNRGPVHTRSGPGQVVPRWSRWPDGLVIDMSNAPVQACAAPVGTGAAASWLHCPCVGHVVERTACSANCGSGGQPGGSRPSTRPRRRMCGGKAGALTR